MKPKLIIGAGVGWAATRSIMHSLKNFNHGLGKEDHILYQLSINDPEHLKFYTESKETIERNKRYGIEDGNPTLDKFIELYLKNAEGYDGVTDFTNANQKLDPFFIRDIKPHLDKHFDVKVVMIFRDPARRLFSECCAYFNNKWVQTDHKNVRDYFMEVLKNGSVTNSEEYAEYFNNWKSNRYKIRPIVMEDLYQNKKDCFDKLQNFLGCSMELYPTAYWPERGVDAPLIKGLSCQKSDTEILSDEDYRYAKRKLRIHYEFMEFITSKYNKFK